MSLKFPWWRRLVVAVAVFWLVFPPAWIGFNLWLDSFSWHQKITMTVETPDGERVGSSVMAVSWWKNIFSGGWGGADKHFELTGEAVTVDLGGGRFLFALLKPSETAGGETVADLLTQVATGKAGRQWSRAAFRAGLRLREPTVVPVKLYPLLVTFSDIDDPKTVVRVEPWNLAAAFGPGYRMKSVTIEVTDEEVTEGRVGQALGWLPTAEYIVPSSKQPRLLKDTTIEQRVMPSDFIDWRTLGALRAGK